MVHSVFTTVSTASGFRDETCLALDSWRSDNFIGIVALHPVPTITPMATRLFGRDLTKYARDERVATVSLVIAAIFNLGKAKSLRLLAEGSSVPYGRRVCRSYPANRILRRLRSEEIANPFPIGISVASPSDSCLLQVSVQV